ncbi:diguanylate cyclase domain-containing protein [Pantanalinema sp. GBBB05]|uniref:diguanylate cyclase domain-containing protein n=1 Tax=Pantanalinema sp. GBBB05 TaxID=2604139 RepID=UPI001D1E8D1D|nr:PleD family two-component system response regulator [Pantanalinema sp. GBBB05]
MPDGTIGNILIVDDLPDNLQLLSRILTRQGYEVQAVGSGRAAIAAVQTQIPDLILLDICMPEMDGYEVCQQLKQNPSTQDVSVIFISALDELGDKVKAFKTGGVDYITKPFQIAEVVVRVKTHMTLRHLQQQLQRQNALLQQEVCDRLAAEAALQTANQELQRLAHLDGLTQVANRRCFDNYLTQEWRRLAREQLPLSLILCDVDFFKQYNDSYGHQVGDECLRQIAKAIRSAINRPADLVARYGGEEFAVILPNTPLSGAVQVGQKIQSQVAQLQIAHIGSQISPFVSLSFGIASIIPMPDGDVTLLITATDRALYQAKLAGRDRIAVEDILAADHSPHHPVIVEA